MADNWASSFSMGNDRFVRPPLKVICVGVFYTFESVQTFVQSRKKIAIEHEIETRTIYNTALAKLLFDKLHF